MEKNALPNLVKQKDEDYIVIDKMYLWIKDENAWQYQYLIRKRENSSLQNMDDPKALI